MLAAPRGPGLTRLGPEGPWLATTPEQAKRVLMDAAAFDFPTNVSRGSDMTASQGDTRTGHHIYAPLSPQQVETGRAVLIDEWSKALDGTAELEAMEILRRPVARATCGAVLEGVDVDTRNAVADLVLAWIDALAPVISSRRSPGRWSRARRGERRTREALDSALAGVLPGLGVRESPPLVATMLAAGIQVPIAAGSWLLVFLAANPGSAPDPDHAVWEALRLTPPTWITARVTTGAVDMAGTLVPAGEVVLVSPLLLGRLATLVPGDADGLPHFDPDRWRQDEVRPGAWLPFGAGAHACPGRTLGFAILRELAVWAATRHLHLAAPVRVNQDRGILPEPARITVGHEIDR